MRSALETLRRDFGGDIIEPGAAEYASASRSLLASGSPVCVLRPKSVGDVQAGVRFAASAGLVLSVRGGGHGFPGFGTNDDGIVIDLSMLANVQIIDKERHLVRIGGGATWGQVAAALAPHGLAISSGDTKSVGVGGLTLTGGIGWKVRKYGLALDNVVAAEVVTANGEVVQASAQENPELFWAIRGGGGNFGIVTEFEFRLHAVGPEVFAGTVFWPMEEAPQVLRFYRDWIADCPDELMTIVVQRRAPDLPVIPRDLVGRHVIAVVACYSGPIDDGERMLRPLKSFGRPLLDLCQPKPYLVHQSMFDLSYPHGRWYYVRACDVAELSDDVIGIVAEYGRQIVSPISSIALWQMGGAVARIGEDDTAFNGRGAGFTFNINGNSMTPDGFDAERQWARDYWSALAPYHSGVYVNFLMDEGKERVRQAYGSAKYDRLKALKRRYDPDNVFRLNQNIPPAP